MRSILTDVKYATRSLRLAPGFTVVALAVLTLGVGATTAIYSIADAVVLRRLPYPEEGRLVRIGEPSRIWAAKGIAVSPQAFFDWRVQQGGVFEAIGAQGGSKFRAADPAFNTVRAFGVTAGFISALRIAPAIGRTFSEENENDGNHRVALINDTLWRRRFNADPSVLGKTMAGRDGPWEIVGVLPPGTGYPRVQDDIEFMWTPFVPEASERLRTANGRFYFLTVIARLAHGVEINQARQRMEDLTTNLAKAYPDWFAQGEWVSVQSLRDSLVGDMRAPLLMLLAAATAVLLIACGNVANLVLVRSTMRSRELSVRSALGASRWQLVRGVLAESLVLSSAGTILGVLVAAWGVHSVRVLLPASLFRVTEIAINMRVLVAAALAASVTGVLFGLAPAWRLSRRNVAMELQLTGGGGTSGASRRRVRSLLIVSEVALAVLLVVGATMFIASFARATRLDLGMDYRRVITMRVSANTVGQPKKGSAERLAAAELLMSARAGVARLPGVERVAVMASGSTPLGLGSSRSSLERLGRPALPRAEQLVEFKSVSPDYFAALGIRIIRGRGFEDGDLKTGSDALVVLGDATAARFFGADEPIGERVKLGNGDIRTVVGVARSVRLRGPEADVVAEMFVPMVPDDLTSATFLVQNAPGAFLASPEVKRAAAVGSGITVSDPRPLTSFFDDLLQARKLNTILVAVFGLLALIIAAVGIYGVMAYVVVLRAREIGVRMALGAQPAQVKRAVLAEAASILGIGAAFGVAGAWILSRYVQTFLFQVQPRDPQLYVIAITLLLATGLAAAYIPARRASRTDPSSVLRT